jgi:uncharacterized membrane protein
MTDNISNKYFKTSPGLIKLAVMYYVRYPLSYRQVEDILSERGIDIATKPSVFGWIDLVGHLPIKSERNEDAIILIGAGI